MHPAASRPVLHRPVLNPAAQRLWRDDESLQVGLTGGQVLTGVDADVRAVLTLLDGTRDVPRVLGDAARVGCAPSHTREVLALLDEGGLLADADPHWPDGLGAADRERLGGEAATLALLHRGDAMPVLARRDRAQVLVLGAGRVGAAVAALLAASGVGTVDVADDAPVRRGDTTPAGLQETDLGRNRGQAARERVQRVAPSTSTGPVSDPRLVVLAPAGTPDDDAVSRLLRAGTPHLLVSVRETVGVVGPLVLPGRSACLTCVEHARTDRDPHWPALAAQLASASRPVPCSHALAAAVAAQAVLQALTLLDGDAPATIGGSLELALPDWRWRRRSWGRHDACACAIPRAG